MKRWFAWIAAALLALSVSPALAESYTLEEKFYKQAIEESAFRGTVTFSAEGNGTAALGNTEWALIKALAPRLSLAVDHTTARGKNEGQASFTLTVDGKQNLKSVLMYDERLIGFSSALLGGENVYYTAARDWDMSRLLQAVVQGENAWPPLWRLLIAAERAPEDWKTRAGERLKIYETKLGLWMNGYAAFSSGRDGETVYSQLSCTIPAQAVKAEIKQLLVDFYDDTELLTLLREVATAQEAAAYLQPAMMNELFAMLDEVQLEGDVEVLRRYDGQGKALLDSISLPFAQSSALDTLKVTLAPSEGGKTWTLQGSARNGAMFDISCLASEDLIFTGSVDVTLPRAEEKSSFVVSDGEAGSGRICFDYNLSWEPGEDEFSLSADRFTRTAKGTLLIRPRDGSDLPEQSLTAEVNLSSGSSQRAATQLNGSIVWRDLESGASFSAVISGRTVSPFAYSSPSSLTGALRLDLMPQASRSVLIQNWAARAAAQLLPLLAGGGQATAPLATVAP